MRYLYTLALILLPWITFAQSTTLFSENWDQVTAPALPTAWTSPEWVTTTSNPSSGSGNQSVMHTGRQSGRLCTPVLNTAQASLSTLTYLARRTGSYPQMNLVIRASTDGGATFPHLVAAAGTALPASTSSWTSISVALPSVLSGETAVQICFDAYGGSSSSSKIQLDDMIITGTGTLVMPSLAFAPVTLDMGFVASGDQVTRSVQVRNQLDTPLTLTLGSLQAPWTYTAQNVSLNPGATETVDVTLAPTTTQTFSATLTFSDGTHTWPLPLTGTSILPSAYAGFATASSQVTEQSTTEIPLDLTLANASSGLQGLSLTVDLPQTGIDQVSVAWGSAISQTASWTLSYEQTGQQLQILLIGNGTTSLPNGAYADLLRLQVTPSSASQVTSLVFAIHTLSATAGDDQGSPLALAIHHRTHTLEVRPKKAYFQLSTATLDVGTVQVGETGTATFSISNPNGERDLTISTITSSEGTFTVSPASATIAPDASATFTVTFAPDLLQFGQIQATLTFTHDGEIPTQQPASLTVTGIGTGGFGDASGEGRVDIADVTRGVDIFLGKRSPDALEKLVLDLAPFPGGDGRIALNDLTLLVRAVATQSWPDGSTLPTPPPVNPAGKTFAQGVELSLTEENGSTRLTVTAHEPFAGLQFQVRLSDSTAFQPGMDYPTSAQVQVGYAPDRQVLTFVLYRLDGALFDTTTFSPGIIAGWMPESVEIVDFVAVGESGHYLPTRIQRPRTTASEDELPEGWALAPPYPQPFHPAQHGRLILKGRLERAATVSATVFDLLGRRVYTFPERQLPAGPFRLEWHGEHLHGERLPAGLYFIRIRAGEHEKTVPIVLTL